MLLCYRRKTVIYIARTLLMDAYISAIIDEWDWLNEFLTHILVKIFQEINIIFVKWWNFFSIPQNVVVNCILVFEMWTYKQFKLNSNVYKHYGLGAKRDSTLNMLKENLNFYKLRYVNIRRKWPKCLNTTEIVVVIITSMETQSSKNIIFQT
jgi:hypothetical protein